MDVQTHWEKICTEKAPDAVSWYRPHLETSLSVASPAKIEQVRAYGADLVGLADSGVVSPHRDFSSIVKLEPFS